MKRSLFLTLGALLLTLVCGESLLAQEWPAYGGDPLEPGPGMYLSWWKILLMWLVFWFWVGTSDWVNRDAQEVGESIGMPYFVWNPIIVFTFLAGFLLLGLLIPIFPVGILLVLVCYAGPLGAYIVQRNARVTDDKKVLTPAHLKVWFSNLGKRRKKQVETKLPHEMGPPVRFEAVGGTIQDRQSNMILARQSPAYITAKELVADALDRRGERIMLDYTREAVGVRYEIDGVWHQAETLDRETADPMLAVLKKICGLDVNERRLRQEGKFEASYRETKYDGELTSQGTKTGERVVVRLQSDKGFRTLEALGMRPKMQETVKQLLGGKTGFIIVCAMPSGGLTTTWATCLKSTDRLLRDFVSVEDVAKPTPYVENVEVVPYNAAAGETPDRVLPKVLLKHPEVMVLPELANAETVRILCGEVNLEGRLVIAGVRAKEAVEALIRVLLLKAPADQFAQAVTCVLNQRLVRRLCDACKQAYQPNPQLLQKLGIPPGRVQALYREWQPPPDEEASRRRGQPEVCPKCHGLGYLGQTAIFELLMVDDRMRQLLVKQPKLDVLRQAARQAGNRTLQEEGILLVAQGVTSLAELQRVLKQ